MASFASELSACSAFPSMCRPRRLWSVAWRVCFVIAGMTFGLRAIIGDQIYLEGLKRPSPATFDRASVIFPYERAILMGRYYYWMRRNEATPDAINAIREGERKDPAAADLIVAEMQFSFLMGQNLDAYNAYLRLAKLAPKSWFVKDVEQREHDRIH